MKFKTGDKVKVVSLSNTFNFLMNKGFLDFLNKTFTVCNTFTTYDSLHDFTRQTYVSVKENIYYWNEKDLILVNNTLEIE